MAVFRIERTKNYTVMSNYHLRDKALSLKSKGLLSMMLSLPEDWNYTTRGLAKICKEGVDAIGGALRELEAAGYIVRHKSARLAELDVLLNMDGRGRPAPETVIAKSSRPSVLEGLRRPVPRNPDKKPKHHEQEVR